MASQEQLDAILQEFTLACQAFSTTPNAETERPILAFQQMPDSIRASKYIIEKSQEPTVLFHALKSLLVASINQWHVLNDVDATKAFILAFGEAQAEYLPPFVINQASTVFSALTKRGWMVNMHGEEPPEVIEMRKHTLREISRLISSSTSTPKVQLFALSLIDALITEFECTRKSSSLDLGAEYHIECYSSFEKDEMLELFVMTLNLLQELYNIAASGGSGQEASSALVQHLQANGTSPTASPLFVELLSKSLEVANRMLSWPFGQVAQILGIFYSSLGAAFRPPLSWRDILITPNMEVLSLFGNIYQMVRMMDEHLSQLVREALTQMASLSGDIFGRTEQLSAESRAVWLNNLSSLISGLLSIDNFSNVELRDMATIVQRFFAATSIGNLVDALGVDNLSVVLNNVSARTLDTMARLRTAAETGMATIGVNAADQFEDTEMEDTVLGETLDTWLSAWASYTTDASNTIFPNLPLYMFEVFSNYVNTRLTIAKSELIQSEATTDSHWTNDAIESIKTKQDLKNPVIIDQLSCVAAISRRCPKEAIEFLRQVLDSIAKPLREYIERSESSQDAWLKLEELHWVIMISGYFLCQISRNESSVIPIPLIRLSHTFDELHEENQVLALISQLFELVDAENLALENQTKNGGVLVWSPLLAETLAWFLAHWSSSYLLLSEQSSLEFPRSITEAYGAASPNALAILDFLMRKIVNNLVQWTGETNVLVQTCKILRLISRLDTLNMNLLVQSASWNELFSIWTTNSSVILSFPPKVQRQLTAAMAFITQTDGVDNQVTYLQSLVAPIDDILQRIVSAPDFQATFQSAPTMHALQVALERIRGLIQSTRGTTFKATNQIAGHYLSGLVELVVTYRDHHSIVLSILKIFAEYVHFVMSCTYKDEEMANYHASVATLIRVLPACGIGKRRTRRGNEDVTEEQYQELLQLLKTMTGVVLNEGEEVAKLCFEAFSVLAPLIDADMLLYPDLSRHFYEFVASIFVEHCMYLGLMDDALFALLIKTLEVGFTQNEDIQMATLNALSKISSFVLKMMTQKGIDVLQQKRGALTQILPILLRWLLFEDGFKTDLLSSASPAYLALMCYDPDTYRETVQALLDSQTDPYIVHQLAELFTALVDGIEVKWSNETKQQFYTHMHKFVPRARSLVHRR